MEIRVKNIDQLREAAVRFCEAAGDSRHFAFHAPMGAGKTTFIAELCRVLGCIDEASSPTFSIVNEYARENDLSVFHFDFYRIESEAELIDMGLDDYFDSGAFCLMEWPENAAGYLPEDVVDVEISVADDGMRIIRI